MSYQNHRTSIEELSASEGIFTAAQANRMGIPRQALSRAVSQGHAERLLHGAYRLAGTPPSDTDELSAIWKLTAPVMFTSERMSTFDGIVIGGSTAASLQGLGDFWLSPYRIYTPHRINSRLKCAHFSVRQIEKCDVTWLHGLPITRPERMLVDLCLDDEDPSLIDGAFADSLRYGINIDRLHRLISQHLISRRKRPQLEHLAKNLERMEGAAYAQ